MNKLSVLVFSVAVIVMSAFSTASAQDLDAAWHEYENSRNIMLASSAQLDESWSIFRSSYGSVESSYSSVMNSWDLIDNAWVEIDVARSIVASTLKIKLKDTSVRGSRSMGLSGGNTTRVIPVSLTPAPRSETLDVSWGALNIAWLSIDQAWAELNAAWATAAQDSALVVTYWAEADAEWAKINAAWAEIDAAWASKQ